jgi:serine/threonine-protein kinase RsbW
VAEWVQAWTLEHEVPERIAQRLDLCSTEAVTNIVMHGGSDGGSQQIVLRLVRRDEALALEIQDEGAPFDPTQVEEAPHATRLEDAAIGGWGVPLIRRFSDDWHYVRRGGRNCLTLGFRVSASGSGAAPEHATK